jgi:hypothetical protein
MVLESSESIRIKQEEGDDIVSSMRAPPTNRRYRTKAFSDISDMLTGTAPYNSRMMPHDREKLEQIEEKIRDEIMNATTRGGRKKTKSDIAAMMAEELIEGGAQHSPRRKRQTSSSDVVTKFGYAPQLGYDDLK